MNSLAIFAFLAIFAVASAGVIAPSAKIIQGPSSRSTLLGPDGSVVTSESAGGQIITEENPGLIAHTAPLVAATPVITSYAAPAAVAYSSYVAPALVAHSAPLVSAYTAPIVSAYAAPAVSAHAAPIVSTYAAPALASGIFARNSVDTVVAGPSGTISTRKTVATPAFLAAPAVYAHGVQGLYI